MILVFARLSNSQPSPQFPILARGRSFGTPPSHPSPSKKKKKARRCGIPMRSKIFYSFARCLKPSTLTPCLYRHPMNNLFLLPPATFGLSFYFCSVHRQLKSYIPRGRSFCKPINFTFPIIITYYYRSSGLRFHDPRILTPP